MKWSYFHVKKATLLLCMWCVIFALNKLVQSRYLILKNIFSSKQMKCEKSHIAAMYVVCNFSGQLRFEICVRATRDSVMIHYCTGKFSLGFLSSKQM